MFFTTLVHAWLNVISMMENKSSNTVHKYSHKEEFEEWLSPCTLRLYDTN